MAVNHVNVIGNLTRDAVLQNTNNGTPVLNFTIAFSESTRQADGTYKDIPQYVDCVMFGNRAEKIAQYFTKGTKLGITLGRTITTTPAATRSRSSPAAVSRSPRSAASFR